jgi:hypothetical protein
MLRKEEMKLFNMMVLGYGFAGFCVSAHEKNYTLGYLTSNEVFVTMALLFKVYPPDEEAAHES